MRFNTCNIPATHTMKGERFKQLGLRNTPPQREESLNTTPGKQRDVLKQEALATRPRAYSTHLARLPWPDPGSWPARLASPGVVPVLTLNVPRPQTPQLRADHEGWSPWERAHILKDGAAKSCRKVQGDRRGAAPARLQPAPRAVATVKFALSWPWPLCPERRPGKSTSTPPLKGRVRPGGDRVTLKDSGASAVLRRATLTRLPEQPAASRLPPGQVRSSDGPFKSSRLRPCSARRVRGAIGGCL